MFFLMTISVFCVVCLAALVVRCRKPNYPLGKRFVHCHENFKAIVIVDDAVTCYGNGFIVSGGSEKVDGKAVAKACALSMKAVSETMKSDLDRTSWSSSLKQNLKNRFANTCVFNFLDPKAFNERLAVEGDHNTSAEFVGAYRWMVKRNMRALKPVCPMAVIRSNNMSEVVKRGQKALHELIHVYAYAYYGTWDEEHELWNDPKAFYEGKTLEKRARERWIVLNNQ